VEPPGRLRKGHKKVLTKRIRDVDWSLSRSLQQKVRRDRDQEKGVGGRKSAGRGAKKGKNKRSLKKEEEKRRNRGR